MDQLTMNAIKTVIANRDRVKKISSENNNFDSFDQFDSLNSFDSDSKYFNHDQNDNQNIKTLPHIESNRGNKLINGSQYIRRDFLISYSNTQNILNVNLEDKEQKLLKKRKISEILNENNDIDNIATTSATTSATATNNNDNNHNHNYNLNYNHNNYNHSNNNNNNNNNNKNNLNDGINDNFNDNLLNKRKKNLNALDFNNNLNDHINRNKIENENEKKNQEFLDKLENSDSDIFLPQINTEYLLKPVNKPESIVTSKIYNKIFKSDTLRKLAERTINLIEYEQNNVVYLTKLMDRFIGADPYNFKVDNLKLPDYEYRSLKFDNLIKNNNVEFSDIYEIFGSNTSNNNKINNNNIGDLDALIKLNTSLPKKVFESPDCEGITNNLNQFYQHHLKNPNGLIKGNSTPSSRTNSNVNPNVMNGNPNGSNHNNIENAIEIDPFFALPEIDLDPDYGFDPKVADAVRKRLQLALQRNEEFVKNLQKIRMGIIRAERLKDIIFNWCKEMNGGNDIEQ
ncbi:Rxt2p ASCRUDRAFT_75295 [Ascoidea rubescens DSM 1968]|uniref:Transcriptional regulatory protein RXT2 N-terminal domain-containing protein n=1 Tax=Ascoidea rubescens DSM 1968 TaxID=1344418 RepID=A0A1D2VKE9_9ASCO|nr:hypothetical protein ASCRUDRAFT_75295 [Ascoidea rubescens DSM 1968]ODV62086.1 hypothetical protein ASCRUDRAFT_75295 [Ascoidea rubescens DSM 1968]